MSKTSKFLRANQQIRFSPIFLIDESGNNLGPTPLENALSMARDKGLDLVEVNPTNRPPICRIMDFGKYKYDLAKKEKESRANRKEVGLKEIRLTFKIGEHDIEYKARQAKTFFEAGNKVKVSMRLRGRENALYEIAVGVFKRFAEKADLAYETAPKKMGNQIIGILTNKPEVKKQENETEISQSNS